MCHEHRHGRRQRAFRRGRFPVNAEELLRGLEEYQKDLEQEVANVADLIRRLREGQKPETVTL